ncbi:Protein CBG26405 [Caenorhabditis briggsae]|uniref:Protein CBG26405 n=1 Tax=Caenorhabditis briggsae TaxID=6238 RepID=B6ILD8_CAEBR|nr:Protein CBG26405 [Caenorhabditis briggsae]CAS00718.1 Protein CBG26405 [Caenorhabditis briggsae]
MSGVISDPSIAAQLTPLEHAVPRSASQNEDDWSAQQAQEFHRRTGEANRIEAMDIKIDKQAGVVRKLITARNAEVDLINARRRRNDDKIETRKERKRISRAIRKRKREEEDQRDTEVESFKRRKMETDQT